MPARIGWVCVAEHAGEQLMLLPGTTVTIEQQRWAYCRTGATDRHQWRAVEALTPDELAQFGPSAEYALGEEPIAR